MSKAATINCLLVGQRITTNKIWREVATARSSDGKRSGKGMRKMAKHDLMPIWHVQVFIRLASGDLELWDEYQSCSELQAYAFAKDAQKQGRHVTMWRKR